MSGPFGSQQWMYSSGFYPHEIGNSARLDTNSYYTRTPSSTGNRKTWTWSAWVKRGQLTAVQYLFAARQLSVNTPYSLLYFGSSDQLTYIDDAGTTLVSTPVYRDSSSWYHIVLSVDTTQATASNRYKLYVNGTQVTAFSTATYAAQNSDTAVNATIEHDIGIAPNGIGSRVNPFNGYLAEINFVDGTALDASSFGENKSGVWIPKRYSGSYGTNGFYLDFGNSGSLGADSSGNGNNWTPTNLAATDQVLDSPTNNFGTLSPLDKNANVALSEGNLKIDTSAVNFGVRSTYFVSSGKWYCEVTRANATGVPAFGVAPSSWTRTYVGEGTGGVGYHANGVIYQNGAVDQSSLASYTTSDVIGIALNMDDKEVTFYKNNVQIGTTVTGVSDEVAIALSGQSGSSSIANFGQDSSFAGQKTAQGNTDANGIGDFYYSPPSGYLALCSANLPDPVAAIDPAQDANPQDHFNTVLYTGTGAAQSITGVGHQPDLVWLKERSSTSSHQLYDSVRGATKYLFSSLTNAETTDANGLDSFDSDGFSLGGNNLGANESGITYVAWNWKAGGTGVSNTVGEISSTVSANQDLGISIITYTGDTSVSNYNVGTGLSSSAPLDMAIGKRRDSTGDWFVGHRFSGQGSNFGYHFHLNTTDALSGFGPYFMGTQSTSNGDRLYIGGDGNINGATYVAYCFQEVEGFSKFGSYTGNGSADGPFVYCGFRPAFVMFKNVSSTGSWHIWDTTRTNINPLGKYLQPDTSNAEGDLDRVDFVSNGFKPRANAGSVNTSGNTYIFMAFAEMPFKYSTAR